MEDRVGVVDVDEYPALAAEPLQLRHHAVVAGLRQVATALEGLRRTMGIDAEPDTRFVQKWARGIPSYAPGHIQRVDRIFEQLARHPGLHLCCNAYRGIAMNDSVRAGRELAAGMVAAA